MPLAPQRPCLGCGRRSTTRRCDHCAPVYSRELDRARGTSKERGFGRQQREWSKSVRGREPLCRGCQRECSLVADHIIPVPQGPDRWKGDWTDENAQALCRGCDQFKRGKERWDKGFSERLRAAGTPKGWRHMPEFT